MPSREELKGRKGSYWVKVVLKPSRIRKNGLKKRTLYVDVNNRSHGFEKAFKIANREVKRWREVSILLFNGGNLITAWDKVGKDMVKSYGPLR